MTVGDQNYVASKGRMIDEWCIGRDVELNGCSPFKALFWSRLGSCPDFCYIIVLVDNFIDKTHVSNILEVCFYFFVNTLHISVVKAVGWCEGNPQTNSSGLHLPLFCEGLNMWLLWYIMFILQAFRRTDTNFILLYSHSWAPDTQQGLGQEFGCHRLAMNLMGWVEIGNFIN
jgi:hypothetical protein